MKKYIIIRLAAVVALTSVLLILVATILQLRLATDNFINTALLQADRTIEILNANDADAEQLEEELAQDYLIRAKTAAYIIQNNPSVIDNTDELATITQLLQIDEIHIFNPEGEIYAGTVPDYYGYTFNSGEQMMFFLPMLTDYSLELVQEVTPNTAENVDMQYVAVWNEARTDIIQIGIRPARLLSAMEEIELSRVFEGLAPEFGTMILAIEPQTGEILSSTEAGIIGSNANDIGIADVTAINALTSQATEVTINGEAGQCIFKITDNMLIGVYNSDVHIYQTAYSNLLIIIASGIVIGLFVVLLIFLIIDKVILSSFYKINDGLQKIAHGDLKHKIDVSNLPEFSAISKNINLMVNNILETSGRFTTVLNYVNLPIAVYEHKNNDTVIYTSKMIEILDLSSDSTSVKPASTKDFLLLIEKIMSCPHGTEEDTFIYNHSRGVKYLKIKLYSEETSNWGIILDTTDEVTEKESIKYERDIDYLTNIYNRRAFLEQLDLLIQNTSVAQNAVVVMMDLDNLKYVNDTWGHAYGDAFIARAAQVLKAFECENKIISRLSGDEFVIVIYGASTNQELVQEVKRLEQDFKDAHILTPHNKKYPVTISGGYALYPDQSDNVKQILHYADTAMYNAKKTKRGSFLPHIAEQ